MGNTYMVLLFVSLAYSDIKSENSTCNLLPFLLFDAHQVPEITVDDRCFRPLNIIQRALWLVKQIGI